MEVVFSLNQTILIFYWSVSVRSKKKKKVENKKQIQYLSIMSWKSGVIQNGWLVKFYASCKKMWGYIE